MAFMISALGLFLSARVKQIQSAMPLVQLTITPLMFLSGSLFPLSNLPGWLHVATTLNPMTYAVEPIRSVVFDHLDLTPAAQATFNPGITWAGWQVPVPRADRHRGRSPAWSCWAWPWPASPAPSRRPG